jgi:hypothetical protein
VSRSALGAVPDELDATGAHPVGMALRKTLEMLERGDRINDWLHESTTSRKRMTDRLDPGESPWDRHSRLAKFLAGQQPLETT